MTLSYTRNDQRTIIFSFLCVRDVFILWKTNIFSDDNFEMEIGTEQNKYRSYTDSVFCASSIQVCWFQRYVQLTIIFSRSLVMCKLLTPFYVQVRWNDVYFPKLTRNIVNLETKLKTLNKCLKSIFSDMVSSMLDLRQHDGTCQL